jgi:hypothetical protein
VRGLCGCLRSAQEEGCEVIGVRVLRSCGLVVVATVCLLVSVAGSGQAVAAEPWWHVNTISAPATTRILRCAQW